MKNVSLKRKIVAVLATALAMVVIPGIGWIAICGIIKLITICFGWTFRWSSATGIWLLLSILNFLTNHRRIIQAPKETYENFLKN